MSDLIDDYFPDGGIMDMTGGRLSIILNYNNPDDEQATDHPDLGDVSPGFQQLAVFELVPLSVTFDNQWTGQPGPDGTPTVDKNGKSARDRAGDTIREQVLKGMAMRLHSPSTFRRLARCGPLLHPRTPSI